MARTSSEFRAAARNVLKGRWSEVVLLSFVYMLIACVFSGTVTQALDNIAEGIGSIASLLLLPLGWAYGITFLCHRRGKEDSFYFSNLFLGYKDFGRIFTTILLQEIYTLLWTLLLIVPGIIKSLSYSLTGCILYDNPEMKNNEAIELSMKMMEGHKLDLFWLQLSFIGWGILCCFTFGIGLLWIIPYVQASFVEFYEDVKAEYEQKQA